MKKFAIREVFNNFFFQTKRFIYKIRGKTIQTDVFGCDNPCLEISKFLSKGIDINQVDRTSHTGSTILHKILLKFQPENKLCNEENIAVLLQHNADINLKDASGNSALIYACYHCRPDIVKALLSNISFANTKGINTKNSYGDTALSTTVEKNDWSSLEKIKMLIEANASIKMRNRDGDPLLAYACEYCNPKVAIQLISFINSIDFTNSKKTINARDKDGNTALLVTVRRSDREFLPFQQEIIKLLVNANADINFQNGCGVSPIMSAIFSSSTHCVESLLNKDSYIDFQQRSQSNRTVLELAQQNVQLNPMNKDVKKMNFDLQSREKDQKIDAFSALIKTNLNLDIPYDVMKLLYTFVY